MHCTPRKQSLQPWTSLQTVLVSTATLLTDRAMYPLLPSATPHHHALFILLPALSPCSPRHLPPYFPYTQCSLRVYVGFWRLGVGAVHLFTAGAHRSACSPFYPGPYDQFFSFTSPVKCPLLLALLLFHLSDLVIVNLSALHHPPLFFSTLPPPLPSQPSTFCHPSVFISSLSSLLLSGPISCGP
jgi:hypothetical protein